MLRRLEEQYNTGDGALAPYAIYNRNSGGRVYPERTHPLRTDFQRDRDRVLHSRAFRRLEYKTQVFLNGTGDHLRTRLTHTIEVAAICRTIARALCLNEDLAETIALAHDLGHTPFGHSGERVLNTLMKDHGGFDHNLQALRVVDMLEIKYPDYDGLNLTWEVRSGLLKHRPADGTGVFLDDKPLTLQPSLESQVADLGDDLTYYGHDVDDALDSGLINENMLRGIKIWELAARESRTCGLKDGDERFRSYTVRCLINMMVGNVVENSEHLLVANNINTPLDAKKSDSTTISFSPDFAKMTCELRDFLYKNVYFHPDIKILNENATNMLLELFKIYVEEPTLMGHTARNRVKSVGIYRTVADYIAGMTDTFVNLEYKKMCS